MLEQTAELLKAHDLVKGSLAFAEHFESSLHNKNNRTRDFLDG